MYVASPRHPLHLPPSVADRTAEPSHCWRYCNLRQELSRHTAIPYTVRVFSNPRSTCLMSFILTSRDQSLDAAGEEGYDEHAMHRSNSHTPLHSPQPHGEDCDGLNRMTTDRLVYNDPYTSPQSASATPPPGGHVHYPPQTFTSVPLRDESDDRASPSPYASGANTPTGSASKKKHWSFLPMHSQTSLENGGQMSEKSGKRPRAARGSSWDLLGERAEWEDFNPKNANVDTLRFAEGDVGTTKVCATNTYVSRN